jgi:hypothetical protein
MEMGKAVPKARHRQSDVYSNALYGYAPLTQVNSSSPAPPKPAKPRGVPSPANPSPKPL